MNTPTVSNRWIDRWFTIVVIFKGIDGALELIGGTALLVVSNSVLQHGLGWIGDISFVANSSLLTHSINSIAHGLTPGIQLYTAIYSLLHGLIKVGLVAALLSRRYALYPTAIVILVLFMIYQIYRIFTESSIVFDSILTVIDGVVVWLTYLEYQRHRPTK